MEISNQPESNSHLTVNRTLPESATLYPSPVVATPTTPVSFNESAHSICPQLALLAGAKWSSGNRIVVLENGDEIFPAMLEAIENARDSIIFLTYVYWEGDIAEEFAKLLARKARNGVRCHVLLDAFGSMRTSRGLLDMMAEAGVVLAKYNPFSFQHPWRYQHRTHRKILVCDSEAGFVGGVGIADDWKGNARHPGERHDFHFRIEGPCVAALTRAFWDNWRSPWTRMRDGSKPAPLTSFQPAAEDFIDIPEENSGVKEDIRVLPLLSSPTDSESEAGEIYELMMDSAKERVRIISAYLIPDRRMINLFRRTAERGVEVELVVPGPHKDSWLAQSRSRACWSDLHNCGVKIHLYQPTMCHAKLTIIDDWLTTVGSINFDLLSFRLNEEANIIVHSEEFASLMIQKFEQDRNRSIELTTEWLENRGRWKRCKESVAKKLPLPYWREGCDY
ncbi:MAG: phosphatidylserine/phosphatidylglycerophosphate/cardiolipin synthase family protein [Verrucomicrobiales bacterium]|nr:phosphatidylserine/phosphatidylglycerophosphate/cardiolipin synthase family protein [Verrucomicrobiales bacterium]